MIELTALTTLAFTYKLLRAILPYTRPIFVPPVNKYIIINGCTDGIGKAYAEYFSKQNHPLILISRSTGKLESLVQELNKEKNVNEGYHKIIKIDFCEEKSTYNEYLEQLNGLKIDDKSISGIINCCGKSHVAKFKDFLESECEKLRQTNINSLEISLRSLDSKYFIDQPFFINLSSHSAHSPLKYSSVYSATKAYASNLLQTYGKENKNVKTLSVEPWYVKTKMTGFRRGWDSVEAKEVVEGSLRAFGGKTRCAGTMKHEIIYEFKWIVELLNEKLVEETYRKVMEMKSKRVKLLSKKNKN